MSNGKVWKWELKGFRGSNSTKLNSKVAQDSKPMGRAAML